MSLPLTLLVLFGGVAAFGPVPLPAQDPQQVHTNLLINETSPYLLQHAHNPVDWHPWGEEAFAKAKREGKPIFLSVGYSTCYWCHVMEVESFEDPEVAAVINKYFVAIKVDREERPDIDEQYMLATQMMTGRGGWPNSVWLRPDGKPWMAGTYFPKKRFILVLEQIHDFWVNRRDDVDRQAEALAKATAEAVSAPKAEGPSANPLSPQFIDNAVAALMQQYDSKNGGLGGAPKFPPHGTLTLLIEQQKSRHDDQLIQPIVKTLDAMWLGGMHDHIGGGFHRYATDADWLLPHFEKMLYDNAQLIRLYADGFQLSGHERYRNAVAEIHAWLKREMTDPKGGFYSALDSGEVGKEGEAYVWSVQKLEETLGKEASQVFSEIYQFDSEGNYLEEATGEKTGMNIPHLRRDLHAEAELRQQDAVSLTRELAGMRQRLLKQRSTWPQPHCDDKVLVSWNGLMIEGLAHAGRVLEQPEYIETAKRAAEFVLDQMVIEGKLQRTYRGGTAKLPAYLDDHVFFAQGLIELHRATGQERWLNQAKHWMDVVLEEFEDPTDGGFFFTGNGHEELIVRSKHLGGGGNLPNTNGYAAQVLVSLHELSGEEKYLRAAERTLRAMAGLMASRPHTSEALTVALARMPSESFAAIATKVNDGVHRAGPVSISASISKDPIRPGGSLLVTVRLDVDPGWHLYAPSKDTGPFSPTTVKISAGDWGTVATTAVPKADVKQDLVLDRKLGTYEGKIEYRFEVKAADKLPQGPLGLEVVVNTQPCDDKQCLRPEETKWEISLKATP